MKPNAFEGANAGAFAGVAPKEQPKPKKKTVTLKITSPEGRVIRMKWNNPSPPTEADKAAAVEWAQSQLQQGAEAFAGATPAGDTGTRPKPSKTTGIGPQFPASRGAELGATGIQADRRVSIEEINARELKATPTEDLIKELARGPDQRTSAKQERYRAVIDELQDRATTAGKNVKLGPLLGVTGGLDIGGVTDAGHLAGLLSGMLLEPAETGASLGKASANGNLDVRDRINILAASPQAGAALGAVGKKVLEKGGEIAAKRAAKTGITPPVTKTGTKAALPREAPPMQVAQPTQMPGFTGPGKPKVPSVLDATPNVGGEGMATGSRLATDQTPIGKPGVTPPAAGTADIGKRAKQRNVTATGLTPQERMNASLREVYASEPPVIGDSWVDGKGKKWYVTRIEDWTSPLPKELSDKYDGAVGTRIHLSTGKTGTERFVTVHGKQWSPPVSPAPATTSVLDEVLGEPKVQPVEQMPPPVAMDSPVKGSVGEAVPRGKAAFDAQAQDDAVLAQSNAIYEKLWERKRLWEETRDPQYAPEELVRKDNLYAPDRDDIRRFATPEEKAELARLSAIPKQDTAAFARERIMARRGKPLAPTSARYGANYGTPQPGQGQRVGYAKPASVLDEVLGNAPAVDANRAKEPWEMGAEEYVNQTKIPHTLAAYLDSDAVLSAESVRIANELDGLRARLIKLQDSKATRASKAEIKSGSYHDVGGYRGSPKLKQDIAELKTLIVSKSAEADEVAARRRDLLKTVGDMESWDSASARVDGLSKDRIADYHREYVETAIREGKPVPAEVLADYPDLAAKYGKTADAPENAPVRPVGASSSIYDDIGPGHPNYGGNGSIPPTPISRMAWEPGVEQYLRPFDEVFDDGVMPTTYGESGHFLELLGYVARLIGRDDMGTVRVRQVGSYFDGTSNTKTNGGKVAVEIFPANGKDGRQFIVDAADAGRIKKAIDDSYELARSGKNAPTSPVETPQPPAATVEPPAQTVTPNRLYHVTDEANVNAIQREGVTKGMVTDSLDDANEYAQMLRNRGQNPVILNVAGEVGDPIKVETASGRLVGNRYRVESPLAVEGNSSKIPNSSNSPEIPDSSSTTPTSARQADINADREALGKAGVSTDDVRKWSELEAKADPSDLPDFADTRPWSDQHNVNAVARLRDLKLKLKAARDAGDDADLIADLENQFDDLTAAIYKQGSEQARALASRQYTVDLDMSKDGVRARAKARATRNGVTLTDKQLAEFDNMAAAYEKAQAQIVELETKLADAQAKSNKPRSSAQTKQDLNDELKRIWDEFQAPTVIDGEEVVSTASGFDFRKSAELIYKVVDNRIRYGAESLDEIIQQVQAMFRGRGLAEPTREDIINAYMEGKEANRRVASEEVRAKRAERARLEAEIRAEANAPAKAEANAKKAAEAAERRAKKAAEKQAEVEANRNAKAEQKARARAERAAADAEAKALREEQEAILGNRAKSDSATKRLEKLNKEIAEAEKRMAEGNPQGPKSRKISTDDARLSGARQRLDAIRQRERAMHEAMQPRSGGRVVADAITGGKLLNPVARLFDVASGLATVIDRALVSGNIAALTSALSKDARVGSMFDAAKVQRVVTMMRNSPLAQEWMLEGKHGTRGVGGRLAGVTDIPAKLFHYYVSMDDMAFNIARRELGKASKNQITERALFLLKNPTREMTDVAMAEALHATYNSPNALGKAIGSVKNVVPKFIRGSEDVGLRAFAGETMYALLDAMGGRFSTVIGNVVKDTAVRTAQIGGVPVAPVAGIGQFAVKGIASALGKTPLTSAERRGLQTMIAKGFTGTAVGYLGYHYVSDNLSEEIKIMRNVDENDKNPGAPYIEYGGLIEAADQIGGPFKAYVYGATMRKIDDASDLTDKQREQLRRQVQMDMMTSTPLTGGVEKISGVTSGRTRLEDYLGSQAASQVPAPIKIGSERLDALQADQGFFGEAPRRSTKTEDESFFARLFTPIKRNLPVLRGTLPEQNRKKVD